MNPSSFHNNRKYFNWILYDIGDRFLEKQIDLYKGDLYDLGCGERPYEHFFLQYCEKYIGVDWGKTLHNLKADVIADLNKPLPIDSEKADTIISLSVMEHLREPQTFLNESYRILKKGGAIILQVPFMWHVHEAPYDFFRYTRFGLQYMFEKAGFVDIHIEAQTGFWTTWFVKLNYQLVRIKYKSWFSKVILKRVVIKFITFNQNFGFWLDERWYSSEDETQGYFLIANKK
jgi:SAM-dependent methyltransferase